MMQNEKYLSNLQRITTQRRVNQQYQSWTVLSVIAFLLVAYFVRDLIATSIALVVVTVTVVCYAYSSSNSSWPPAPPPPQPQQQLQPARQQSETNAARSDKRLLFTPPSLNNSNMKGLRQRRTPALDEHHFSSENYDLHSPQRIAHSTYTEEKMRIARQEEDEDQLRRQQYNQHLSYGVSGSIISADFGTHVQSPAPTASSPSPQARSQKFQHGLLYCDATPQNANRYASSPKSWSNFGHNVGIDENAGGDPAHWLNYQTSPIQSNVIFDSDDSHFVDSSITRSLQESSYDYGSERVTSGKLMGTPSYKSPALLKKLGLGETSNRSSRGTVRSTGEPTDSSLGKYGSPSGRGNNIGPQLGNVVQSYINQQHSEVQTAAFDIVQQLSLKTSRTPVSGFSGASSSGVVLTNDDLVKVRSVLELQTDRQLLSNGSTVGRTELMAFARANNVPTNQLNRYDSAVQHYRTARNEAKSMLDTHTTGDSGLGSDRISDIFYDEMFSSPTRKGRSPATGSTPASGSSATGNIASASKGRRYGLRY